MTFLTLPDQATDVSWPTTDWPAGPLPASLHRTRFDALIREGFTEPASDLVGETHALVIIHAGRVIFERYGATSGPDATQPSWSMAKSITHALVGILVAEGKLDIHRPANVPEWQGADDPRAAITLDMLLRMSSGLTFVEDYVPGHPSDVIAMLYGVGKGDVAHYAADLALAHPAGSFWNYASGTTNIIARLAAQAHGGDFAAFMRERLFAPLGMTSATPKFDAAGTFIGSSYCFCTARDFARFGLLYLRDGVWEDRRLLPQGWVDYARTRTPAAHDDAEQYGAQWWLGIGGPGSFSANGYDGQFILIVPDLDLVVVRNGATPLDKKDELRTWMGELVAAFR